MMCDLPWARVYGNWADSASRAPSQENRPTRWLAPVGAGPQTAPAELSIRVQPFRESVTTPVSLYMSGITCGAPTEFKWGRRKFPAAHRVFQRPPENCDGFQIFPTARQRIPTGLQEISKAHRLFRRLGGNSGGSQSSPTARRRTPMSPRKLRWPPDFSDGTSENANGARESLATHRVSQWLAGDFQRTPENFQCLPDFQGGSQNSPKACWRAPACPRKRQWPTDFSGGALENASGSLESPAAHRVFPWRVGECPQASRKLERPATFSGGSPRSPVAHWRRQ